MAKRQTSQVEVEQGRLVGRWDRRSTVATFKGVPFAAPPVGDLRWRPPQPAASWSGARPAVKDGPMAVQRAADLELFLDNLLTGQGWSRPRVGAIKSLIKHAPQPRQDEDCLYLSIRTPDPSPEARLPVMVWIHGGDHQDGSGSDVYYNSGALARHGVVTVNINYRLGVMGYLAHPELRAESAHGVAGNYGTLDQIAALEWVRDNIAGFGGDPGNVTIFGESAGGESVIHMMTSPLARGLFHRAIPQSPANGGQMIHLDQPFLAYDSAVDMAARFAAELGITGGDQIGRLRSLPPDDLYALARTDREIGSQYPIIDGHVLPESPFATFAGGRQAPVPLIIGSNADEGTLIQPLFDAPMAEYRHQETPADSMPTAMVDAFGDDLPRLVELYPGLERRLPQAEIDFAGDHMFGGRAYFYAGRHSAAGHPAHLYLFARTPKGARQTAGAYHAAELPFVHGSRVPVFPMTADDKLLSIEMMRYWTDFAKTGDPNGASRGRGGHPAWPRFSPDHPTWMVFDHSVRTESVDRREKYEILNARTERLVAAMGRTSAG